MSSGGLPEMKHISSKEYSLLSKQEQNDYLVSYLETLLSTSIRKQQSSDNYTLPAWPYYQAEELGVQKSLNKILNLIKYND